MSTDTTAETGSVEAGQPAARELADASQFDVTVGDCSSLFLPGPWGDLQASDDSIKLYDGRLALHSTNADLFGTGQIEMGLSVGISLCFNLEMEFADPGNNPTGLYPAVGAAFSVGSEADLEMVSTGRNVSVSIGGKTITSHGKDSIRGNVNPASARFETLRVSCPSINSDEEAPVNSDQPESMFRVRFHVFNFGGDMGKRLRRPGSGEASWSGRTETTFGPWRLTLDSLPDVRLRLERLKTRGGFDITHHGDLRRIDNKWFAPAEAEDALNFVYWILSFVNGARCGCGLAAGYRFTDHALWEQWIPNITKPGFPDSSWFPRNCPDDALSIAARGWEIWKDNDRRSWFSRVIAIYTDCNRNNSGTEVELAKAQIALELLSWVVLREEHTVISEDGLDKLNAHDRLRMLLSWSRIPTAIPAELSSLSAQCKGTYIVDGPQAITEIRNCTIHPTKANLAKLNGFSVLARAEAWWLSIWYIEMVLLRLFNYNGTYENRLDRGRVARTTEKVPWSL